MNVNENGRDIYFNPNLSNNYCVLDNKLKGNQYQFRNDSKIFL